MKTIFKFSACICFLMMCQMSNAQLLKRIQERVETKVEEKVEQKATEEAEKAADDVLNKVLGNTKKSSNNSNATNSYTFNQSITLEIETDGTDKAQLDFLFDHKNPNVLCMKMDTGDEASGQVYAVITPTESTLFMNMPGMKMKKKVSNTELGNLDYSDKVPQKSDLKKTGKTKTILGYTCYEYFYENDGGKVRAWVTNDFPIKGKFIPILGMKQNGPFDGFVMELTFKTTNESATIKVVQLDTNMVLKINATEYTSM